MAKKRRRKKEDPVQVLYACTLIAAFIIGYRLFGTLGGGLVGVGAVLGLSIAAHITIRQYKRNRLLRSGIKDVDKMEGRQFEHYLSALFTAQGYRVKVTPASKDFGADLILSKDGKKIIVQAKRYSSSIGISAIQEAHSAVPYYGGTEAWVVSNQEFTKPAIALARTNGVKLIGRKDLIQMLLKHNPNGAAVDPKNVIAQIPHSPKTCSCGQPMTLRNGPHGQFWGCKDYPRCQEAKPLVK